MFLLDEASFMVIAFCGWDVCTSAKSASPLGPGRAKTIIASESLARPEYASPLWPYGPGSCCGRWLGDPAPGKKGVGDYAN